MLSFFKHIKHISFTCNVVLKIKLKKQTKKDSFSDRETAFLSVQCQDSEFGQNGSDLFELRIHITEVNVFNATTSIYYKQVHVPVSIQEAVPNQSLLFLLYIRNTNISQFTSCGQ